jgi:formate dehydrogenase major subunit
VRGKGKFIVTEYVPTTSGRPALPADPHHRPHPQPVQRRRADAPHRTSMWHDEDVLEIHPHDAEQRGIRDGDWVR